jgi:hypothetical protein
MISRLRRGLDPLDLEIVERAFHCALDTIRSDPTLDLESDEELESALRRELEEMVRSSGISDPEGVLDVLVADFSERYGTELRIRSQTGD